MPPSGDPLEPAVNFAHRFKNPEPAAVAKSAAIDREKTDVLAWTVSHSFGYIKDELIALCILVGMGTLIAIIVILTIVNAISRPQMIDAPPGHTIIYPPGEPPRLDPPLPIVKVLE